MIIVNYLSNLRTLKDLIISQDELEDGLYHHVNLNELLFFILLT